MVADRAISDLLGGRNRHTTRTLPGSLGGTGWRCGVTTAGLPAACGDATAAESLDGERRPEERGVDVRL